MEIAAIVSKIFKMSGRKLGVYSCAEYINVVEVAGRHVVSQVRIPLTDVSEQEKKQLLGDSSIPGQYKRSEIIKEALANNHIKARKAILGLFSQEQALAEKTERPGEKVE